MIITTITIFVAENNKVDEVIDNVHATFFLAWMSECITCTSPNKIILEYSYYVEQILTKVTGGLGSLILSMNYRAIHDIFGDITHAKSND